MPLQNGVCLPNLHQSLRWFPFRHEKDESDNNAGNPQNPLDHWPTIDIDISQCFVDLRNGEDETAKDEEETDEGFHGT